MVGAKKITLFDILNITFLTLLCILTLYPVIYVLFSSVSDPLLLSQQRSLMLFPVGFSLDAYDLVLSNPSILSGYRNTIFYTVFGTSINMLMTILGAFVISRPDLYVRKRLTIFIIFTMQFGGGLIPTYVVIESLLGSSIWTQVLPGAIGVSNLLIMRTGFAAIPDSLIESAKIDGAHDGIVLTKIILPLAKPTLAVLSLYYGVAHWNKWLPASMYLRDRNLYPLQLFLREILIQNSTESTVSEMIGQSPVDMSQVIQYATIMVSIIPVLCVYPFLQKYFVKGVMLGAVKG